MSTQNIEVSAVLRFIVFWLRKKSIDLVNVASSLNPKHNRKCSQLEMFADCVFYCDRKHWEMKYGVGRLKKSNSISLFKLERK